MVRCLLLILLAMGFSMHAGLAEPNQGLFGPLQSMFFGKRQQGSRDLKPKHFGPPARLRALHSFSLKAPKSSNRRIGTWAPTSIHISG